MPSRRRALAVALIVVSFIAAACSKSDDKSADGELQVTTTRPSASDRVDVELPFAQSLWVYDRLARIELDGDEAAVVDLTSVILRELESDPDESFALADDVTFERFDRLEPELIDRDASVRRDVSMIAGVLDTPQGRSLAVLGTPDADSNGPIAFDDGIRLDLTFIDALRPGDPLQFDVSQTLAYAAADPAEAELEGLELLRHRIDAGQIRYLGEMTDDGARMYVATDELGMTVAGSTKGELPAGAGGLFDGMAEGLANCKGGVKCVDNYFDKTESGFQKSMDWIDCMLTPGCDNDGGDRDRGSRGGNDRGGSGGGSRGSGGTSGGGNDSNRGGGGGSSNRGGSGGGTGSGGGGSGSSGGGWSGSGGSRGTSEGFGGSERFGEGASVGDNGKVGKLRGDPHLQTFDGLYYGMQAVGEFVSARSAQLEVQIRTAPMGDSKDISIVTAVAVGVGDHRLMIADGSVWIDGEPNHLAVTPGGVGIDGAAIWHNGTAIEVVTADGVVIRVQRTFGQSHDVWIGLPEDDASEWTGLMGNTDGDRKNDFRTRDGEVLVEPVAFDDLYGTFIESWRVDADESLFHYEEGESTETFVDRSFPAAPVTIETLPALQRARAEMLCRLVGVVDEVALTECIIDFALTGDIATVRGALTSDTIEGVRSGRLQPTASKTSTTGTNSGGGGESGEAVTVAWATTANEIRGDDEWSRYNCPRNGSPFRVWGTDVYSDDSSICTAAVHIGLITFADGGEVLVEHTPGEDSYVGSTRNGVTTESWRSWPASFVFIGATGRPIAGPDR